MSLLVLVKTELSLKRTVSDATGEYKRYHSPEAAVKLIKKIEGELILHHAGPFCRCCGAVAYLEDFSYELKRFANAKIELVSFKEHAPEGIGEVRSSTTIETPRA